MSAIKKMNQELKKILGREPTIHEQIDILILKSIKETKKTRMNPA